MSNATVAQPYLFIHRLIGCFQARFVYVITPRLTACLLSLSELLPVLDYLDDDLFFLSFFTCENW